MPHVCSDGVIQELWTLSADEVALLPGIFEVSIIGEQELAS